MKFSTDTSRRFAFRRGSAGFVGMVVGCIGLAGVVALFGDASSMQWLAATPENLAAMQRCDRVAGTAPRRACAQAIVAAKARDSQWRLARQETQPGDASASN